MATAKQLSASIDPGSIPFGHRQALQDRLGKLGVTGPPMAGGGMGGPGSPLASGNPLDALAQGHLKPGQGPLTSGLSVGPGPGPADQMAPSDDLIDSLRQLALFAQSPVLRSLARRALRSQIRGSNAIK